MDEVLAFWFSHSGDWWVRSAAFDEEIRRRFEGLRAEVLRGEHEDWKDTARGTLAYVIVLDQFSRNLYRKDGRAFEGDGQALAAARMAIARGDDAGLTQDERFFLYMPFMHSEDLEEQERSVELFRALGDAEGLKYAEQHRDVVRRFGRFPHRNTILGRTFTAHELDFLKEPGSSFA